jgi:hypothetical protein
MLLGVMWLYRDVPDVDLLLNVLDTPLHCNFTIVGPPFLQVSSIRWWAAPLSQQPTTAAAWRPAWCASFVVWQLACHDMMANDGLQLTGGGLTHTLT